MAFSILPSHADRLRLHPVAPRIAPMFCLALLTVSCALASFALACATPFAAFAVLARFGGVAPALRRATPEQAYVVRTLLVHAYRRLRLRDPQLPREVLSTDWPGAAAYALARGLYRSAQARGDRSGR